MVYRIDDTTAVSTLPALPTDNISAPGYFTGGSTGGQAATRVRFWWLNMVQEELATVALAAGLVLNKSNNGQVLAAIKAMIKDALAGAGGSLDFMPVQQGGGPDQTNDTVAIGNNTGDQQVLRYSINGGDCGPIVSGRYGWVPDDGDYPIFSIHWSGGNGRPIVGYGLDLSAGLTWAPLALYPDIQTLQTNLNTEQVTRADQVATLTANVSACVSGVYGKSTSDYQILGLYQQDSTGRPVVVFNNGTTTVYNGIANYADVTTIQTNLTSFQAQQADQNSTFASGIAARIPTNAANDGTNAPITLMNFFLETGMLWFSANGEQSNVAQTNPGTGWNAIKNITVEGDSGALTVLDTTGETNTYAPCSANIQSDTVSVTKIGSLVIQTFEATITNPNNGGAGSVVIQLPQALTESILFTSGNALGGTQGATSWIPSVNVFPTSLTEVTVYADNLQNLNWTQAVTVKVMVIGS